MKTEMGTHEGRSVRQKAGLVPPVAGFTLIEILTVIAIISILAAILVPVVGKSKETALKRRAVVEMNSIKVAVRQFHADHKYMPWGDPEDPDQPRVGNDVWTENNDDLEHVMRWLTGENPVRQSYLQIPEKSQDPDNPLLFVDPWGQTYRIGMDRNMDGAMLPNDPDSLFGGSEYVREPVLVYTLGPKDKNQPMKTFDIPVP